MSKPNNDFKGTERFEIRRQLGAGGMGIVYAAYDREMERLVALKTLTHAEAADIYRFKREFRALADVAHPNLVSLYELMSDGVYWFFTMELVDGVDFFRYVRGSNAGAIEQSSDSPTLLVQETEPNLEGGLYTGAESPTLHTEAQTIRPTAETFHDDTLRPESPTLRSGAMDSEMPLAPRSPSNASLNLKRLRSALTQLATGVAALHETQNLHCDIKPSNVLVTGEGRVVLLDFGLVTEATAQGFHMSLPMAGTPTYMSPEQVAQKAVSEASDWYSVGVMLYEALTGRPPFVGTFLEVLRNKQSFEPVPPRELLPDLPEDLDALCRDLLRRDPRARPTGREVLRRLEGTLPGGARTPALNLQAAARHAPFIGRERHLKALEAAFFATRQGKTVTVYIHGNSGMGKSSLVAHYLESLQYRGENVLVLEGRCYERESVPYKALDGVVDSLSKYLMSLPQETADALMPKDVRALARLFPVMLQVRAAARASAREQETPDLLTLRRRAFAALRELLARLAARQPLIIYIDDLQWADADGAALLGELLRPPGSPPLLLIASFRSEDIESKPFLKSLLERADDTSSLALAVAPLSDGEARHLTRSLLPEKSAVETHVETIVREAAGSPFFVEQLARYALASKSATTQGITLSEMLDARLSHLPEGARELVETLAVAGRPVNAEVAYQAAGLAGDEQPLIASLRAAHFLRGGGSNKGIELYHDRMRETMTSKLPPDAVRRIHGRLARTLEEKGFDDPEALFEHHLGAGENLRAARYAAEAARKAAAALAFDHAAHLYRRALELSVAPEAELVELKAGLGEALANAGRLAEASESYLDAARLASPRVALEFRRRAAEHLLMGGHIDEGLEVTRDVLTAVGLKLAPGPKRALLSLLLRRAQLRLRGLKYVERDASAIPEEDLLRIDICWSVAAGLAVVDNIRGADFQTRHLLLALQAGEPYRIARALAVERGFSATAGGAALERSEKFGEAARTLAAKVGHPHAVGMSMMNDGIAAYLVGEWKKGLELCERATEILRDRCTGVTWELTILNRFTLTTLMYMGEMAEVSRRLPLLISTYKEQGNRYGATDLRTRLNLAWLASDEPDRGRAEIIEAMQEWPHKGFHLQHYGFMHSHAQIMLYTGDSLFAWKYLEEQWPALKSSMLMRIQLLRIEALHLRARCALAVAKSHAGTEAAGFLHAAERLAHRIERERMGWTAPLVALIRAAVAHMRGKRETAVDYLTFADTGSLAFDMNLYAAAARRRRGSLIGGDEGHALLEAADEWMRRQEIKNPQLLTRTLAPGFDDDFD